MKYLKNRLLKESQKIRKSESQSRTHWLTDSLTHFKLKVTGYKLLKSVAVTLTFIIASFPILSISIVSAANLADNNDIFEIVSPSPNQTVGGTIQVSVRAYDDDQSNIQFYSRLFDVGTCHDQPFGSITSANQIPSSSSQTFRFNWNTNRTTNISSIDDGAYCLETCVFLQNGSNPYSACKSRTVNIRNHNRNPVINSQPQRLNFNEGEVFRYQIVASDPDGDRLSYRFITTNDQFEIDQSGLVASYPLTTNGARSVSIPIRIAVSDQFGGEVQQSFTVVVNRAVTTPDDNEEEPDDEEPSDDEEPTEPVDDLDIDIENFQFIVPKKDSTFTDNAFFIEWENLNSSKPIELELSYKAFSDSEDNWKVISNDITNEQNYFLWDIKNINDSDYQVRISFLDAEEKAVRLVSDVFKISREQIDDETDVEAIPLIKNVKPENNSVLDKQNGITITGEFLPSEGAEILVNQVEIKLDGRIISPNCEITQSTFSCPVEENLPAGRHIISVSITDSLDKTNKLESIFRIELENQPPTSLVEEEVSGDQIKILGIDIAKSTATLIGLICLIAGILLFVPWILYSLAVREKRKEIKSTVYVNEDPGSLSTENLPEVNVFAPPAQDYYQTPDVSVYTPPTDYSYVPESAPVEPIQPYVAPYTPDVNVNVNMAVPTPTNSTQSGQKTDDQFVEPTQTS